jgi:hypothetical protein
MRLEVPELAHSAEPSSVLFRSIDPDVSNTTRMLGRRDCAWAAPARLTAAERTAAASRVERGLAKKDNEDLRPESGGQHTSSAAAEPD